MNKKTSTCAKNWCEVRNDSRDLYLSIFILYFLFNKLFQFNSEFKKKSLFFNKFQIKKLKIISLSYSNGNKIQININMNDAISNIILIQT